MLVLQDLLTWKAARKSILAGVHDPHARTMSATITRLDRRWMILAATVETDPAARRTAIGGLVTGRLAAVTERDVPDQLVTEFRDLADRTWVFAEDAPNADDVINWLRMGFSLEERGHLRAALESLTKKDVVAFAHKVAKPDASATGFLRTGK
jgi:hypothetical protein